MASALWNFIFFIIALGLLVTIHEGGHFFAARYCKVKVYRFAIGFGPVIYRRIMKSGTEFAICLLPLGGYVKMKGEQGDEEDESQGLVPNNDEPHDYAFVVSSEDDTASKTNSNGLSDSFADKTIAQRALIIGAGPIANIVLAFLLYAIMNMVGVNTVLPVVGQVLPDSKAAQAPLHEYDLIKRIDGVEIKDWQEAATKMVTSLGETVNLDVSGNLGKDPQRSVVIDLKGIDISPSNTIFDALGFTPCTGEVSKTLTLVQENSPAAQAGLREGDEIIAVNGRNTPNWLAIKHELSLYDGGAVKVDALRSGEVKTFILVPNYVENERTGKKEARIGIGTEVKPIPEIYTIIQYGPIDAFVQAGHDTARMSMVIMDSLSKMVQGIISPKNIAGPIALAKGAGESADIGFSMFLWFLASLSVNLGVLNLMPIPVLDGGQLVYLGYEKVMKRKPNEKVQMMLTALGLSIILGLTFLAIFNDLASL